MAKEKQHSQVLGSEITKIVSDGKVKVEVVLQTRKPPEVKTILLDIYIHTVRGIDINTPVIDTIGDFVILERSYSGGGNSDGDLFSGRHFELQTSKSGWYRIPSFDIYYTDTTKGNPTSLEHISTKSFRYIIYK